MSTGLKTTDPPRDTIQAGARGVSVVGWWIVAPGALWIWIGAFVLPYRVGSVVAVATLAGVAFVLWLTQVMASLGSGILGMATGITTLARPASTPYVVAIFAAWHVVPSDRSAQRVAARAASPFSAERDAAPREPDGLRPLAPTPLGQAVKEGT